MQRDLNRPEKQAKEAPLKFNKHKDSLHLGLNNPVKQHRLITDWSGGSFAEEELGVMVADRLNMSSKCTLATRQNHHRLRRVRKCVTSRSRVMLLLYVGLLRL